MENDKVIDKEESTAKPRKELSLDEQQEQDAMDQNNAFFEEDDDVLEVNFD